jgi:hypothetical protein
MDYEWEIVRIDLDALECELRSAVITGSMKYSSPNSSACFFAAASSVKSGSNGMLTASDVKTCPPRHGLTAHKMAASVSTIIRYAVAAFQTPCPLSSILPPSSPTFQRLESSRKIDASKIAGLLCHPNTPGVVLVRRGRHRTQLVTNWPMGHSRPFSPPNLHWRAFTIFEGLRALWR